MQWTWVVLGVVFFGIAIYFWAVWRNVEKSITASKPLIEKAVVYEQHPAHPSFHLLVAGDSTGVGVGAADNKDSIAGRIGQDFPNADITNISHSGDLVKDLENKLSLYQGKNFDIVLLQIGANDITGGSHYEDVRKELDSTLTYAHKLGKKVIVMTSGDVGLSPAFMWPLSKFFDYSTRRIREIFISETVKYPDTTYVDLFNEEKDEPFNTDIPRYYAADHFHPSGEGYRLWYQKLKPLL